MAPVQVLLVVLGVVSLALAGHSTEYRQSYSSGSPTGYKFSWTVEDEESRNSYGQEEERVGDLTTGSYRIRLPDGRLQVVKYRVDKGTGFIAEVTYDDKGSYTAPYKAYPSHFNPVYSYPDYEREASWNDPVPGTRYSSRPSHPVPSGYRKDEADQYRIVPESFSRSLPPVPLHTNPGPLNPAWSNPAVPRIDPWRVVPASNPQVVPETLEDPDFDPTPAISPGRKNQGDETFTGILWREMYTQKMNEKITAKDQGSTNSDRDVGPPALRQSTTATLGNGKITPQSISLDVIQPKRGTQRKPFRSDYAIPEEALI